MMGSQPPKKRSLWNAVSQDLDRALAICGLSNVEQILIVRARELSLTRSKLRNKAKPSAFKINVTRLAKHTDCNRPSLSRGLSRLVSTHVLNPVTGRPGVYRINPDYRSWTGDHKLTRRQLQFAMAVGSKAKPEKVTGEYEAYLLSPAWQEKRAAVLKRDGYTCRVCPSKRNLHVHHRTYERIFNEDLDDLTTLCEQCHFLYHRPPSEEELRRARQSPTTK